MWSHFGLDVARSDIGAPFLDQGYHVGRKGGFEGHFFLQYGVIEAEGLGVEGLSGAEGEALFDKLRVLAEAIATQDLVPAVTLVVEEGVPDGLHVRSDLVGAPRLEAALDARDVAEAFEHTIMGDGGLAYLPFVGEGGHLHAILGITCEVGADGSFVLLDRSPNDGFVEAMGRLVEKLCGEVCLHLGGLGDDEETAGVLVDAVDKAQAWVGGIVLGRVFEVKGDGIEHRACVVAMPGVDDESGLLVDDHDVVVLVDDVERDVLGDDLELVRRTLKPEGDDIEGLDLVVGLDRLLVDKDDACIGGLLHTVARDIGHPVDEVFVDTYGLLAFVYRDAEVFVQFGRCGVSILIDEVGEVFVV